MKERVLMAAVLATFLLVSTSEAQVAQLGRMPTQGKVKQVGLLGNLFHRSSMGCDSCGDPGCGVADPGCGIAVDGFGVEAPVYGIADPGYGVVDPACGAAGPTCGMAGSFFGKLRGRGRGCSVPEPACGSVGLGYSGGFGLCGGSCDSCGVGGYMGRNLHQVNPCACGGSLVADMARGLITMVDRAVGKIVGGFFGGLQAVSCHASGTFAALQCAAEASCVACGGGGCEDGCVIDPGYSFSDTQMSDGYGLNQDVPDPAYTAAPSANDIQLPTLPAMAPTSIQSEPIQPKPYAGEQGDPFLDDPTEPQANTRARQLPVAYRQYDPRIQQVRNTHSPQQAVRIGSSVQQTMNRVKTATAHATTPLQHRYLRTQNRDVTIRR